MNPYEKIKEITKEKGISVRELEKRMGYSNGYFSKWAKVSPNSDNLSKVADYLAIDVNYLLGRTDNPSPAKENSKRDLTIQEAIDTAMTYDGKPLTEKDKAVIKRITEAYLDGNL